MAVKGIDIHHAKDVKDLQLVWNAGYRLLIHKASEGNWFRDPSMMERMPIAWEIGFVLGSYHFYRSNVPGQEQAYYFLTSIEPLRILTNDRIIPGWCDLETTDGQNDVYRMQQVLQFLRIVNNEFKQPGIYSSAGFWHSHTTKPTWIKYYWQWLAQWTSANTYNLPIGWSEKMCPLWQKGIAGVHSWMPPTVPGIRGAVDIDVYDGTLTELKTWAGYDVAPSPSPSPSPSTPPNNGKLLASLDLMLRANVSLEAAIDLTREVITDGDGD